MINEEGLRDWFGKSKSKDGKKGWVNVVTGGTCASDEPGEGTPKCVSSAKRASMTKAERLSAQRRKKKADPGQQQKSGAAKPTYVSTDRPKKKMNESKEKDHEYSMARSQLSTVMNAAKRLKSKMEKGEGEIEAWVQSKITKAADYLDSAADYVDSGEMNKEETVLEAKDKPGKSSGKKDACYHKVKSRYSVWPSAYASGALVKCRKVGAANWGNSTKKEEMEGFYDLPELTETQIAALKYAGYEVEVLDEKCWKGYEKKGMKTMFGKRYPNCVKKEEVEVVDEKTRVLEGLTKKEETIDETVRVNENGNVYLVSFTWRAKFMMMKMFFPEVRKPTRQEVSAALEKVYPGCMVQRFDLAPRQPGEPLIMVDGYQGGSPAKPGPDNNYIKPMGEGYDPGDVDEKLGAVTAIPKKERDAARDRLLAKAKAKREKMKKEGYEVVEAAAWTKKSGKNPEGGLNEKGRKSYERENPGSDLKAPSKKVGNKRRASFCARMKGMKKKLTSSKTANDPDSRINKSLRAWNC
jgi:hypothetical protein|tara:strand:+ start:179 stop:1747 length:1569 start_codon:yes stop_codon:yes gene_type:complete